jgi:hypothetical protein
MGDSTPQMRRADLRGTLRSGSQIISNSFFSFSVLSQFLQGFGDDDFRSEGLHEFTLKRNTTNETFKTDSEFDRYANENSFTVHCDTKCLKNGIYFG